MQTIEILLNKFLIFKVIFLTVYGNGLKLTMIFSPSRNVFQDPLSASEIFAISQEISSNYSPVAFVKSQGYADGITLSPKELFEISEEIARKYTPKIFTHTPNLVLLPIDPENLYASWNLGDAAAVTPTSKDDTPEMVLRIYPQPDENTNTTTRKPWFDVVIDKSQTQQNVFVPMESNAGAYSAAIGKRYPDDCLTALATSKIVHIPPGNMASNQFNDSGTLPNNIPQALSSIQVKSHNTRKNASGLGK